MLLDDQSDNSFNFNLNLQLRHLNFTPFFHSHYLFSYLPLLSLSLRDSRLAQRLSIVPPPALLLFSN